VMEFLFRGTSEVSRDTNEFTCKNTALWHARENRRARQKWVRRWSGGPWWRGSACTELFLQAKFKEWLVASSKLMFEIIPASQVYVLLM
jgi:hypothetical protein